MEVFRKLGITEPVLKSIADQKFEKPTEIQEKSIPLVMERKDVIAKSATGSGKTLAFGAGILRSSVHGKGIQALVMTPTRELADQVTLALRSFAKYQPLNIVEIFGGLSIEPQIKSLRTADVVVGTPGRILDHLTPRSIDLSRVRVL